MSRFVAGALIIAWAATAIAACTFVAFWPGNPLTALFSLVSVFWMGRHWDRFTAS